MLSRILAAIHLNYVLRVAGVAVFGITAWKGVHGFFPTAGLIVGAAMWYVGTKFDKIYT